jgi:multicomponent Na+:H+ antiporter subunit E
VAEIVAVVLIALLWAFLAANLTLYNLVIGALLGLLLLAAVSSKDRQALPWRVLAFLRFVVIFAKELVVANVMIALLALKPRPVFYPHVIAVPLRLKSDGAIAVLSGAITLLPGTVAMGVSDDRRYLYAHAIGIFDIQEARDAVSRMESLILGFTR